MGEGIVVQPTAKRKGTESEDRATYITTTRRPKHSLILQPTSLAIFLEWAAGCLRSLQIISQAAQLPPLASKSAGKHGVTLCMLVAL